MSRHPPAVLCVGGLDPSGGAGLLADAEAIWNAHARPLAAATAITVQSRRGVARVVVLPAALVIAQVERLFDDEAPAAVKLGMLGSSATARALALLLSKRLGRRALIVDPVLRSSSGASLFRGHARRDYAPLFALARVVTPNLPEAESLLGGAILPGRGERERAARDLSLLGRGAIVLKGGHQEHPGSDDLIFERGRATWLRGKRLAGSKRGTGCRFASTLAARLALGADLVTAARAAKASVRRYLLTP